MEETIRSIPPRRITPNKCDAGAQETIYIVMQFKQDTELNLHTCQWALTVTVGIFYRVNSPVELSADDAPRRG